jgi:hypothetical protein
VMAAAMRVAQRSMRPISFLDDAARLKGTSDIARPALPMATHRGKLTARRLVITFVPTTGRKLSSRLAAYFDHGPLTAAVLSAACR